MRALQDRKLLLGYPLKNPIQPLIKVHVLIVKVMIIKKTEENVERPIIVMVYTTNPSLQ